ncbi:hypothetical protein I5Q34_29580 [Streptomyces sp. AV19]|uniref:hypothetical protein n=1 Tax=Streptomyces sp. AV19 TaxID=2793068 RepID=UPI0018FE105F|nr:hypothetical protein [Streptomyces sp. AV19]MBH1938360.1 hypothetical protein [Streptomyces sp. AV19]MDG4535010.1 hypothetical protein [Streptomyces sp. AV19]
MTASRGSTMTLRVSRDSGQNYGPATVYSPGKNSHPIIGPGFPPCSCPTCRPKDLPAADEQGPR